MMHSAPAHAVAQIRGLDMFYMLIVQHSAESIIFKYTALVISDPSGLKGQCQAIYSPT
jgi:hypothetical protein